MSPGYFQTMGIPLREGEDFVAADDTPRAPQVAIINESFARRHFTGVNPVGRRIRAYGAFDWRIVGVVADTRGGECAAGGCAGYNQGRLERVAVPEIYTPLGRDLGNPDLYVALRVSSPMGAVGPLRELVRGIDPSLPVEDLRTMEQAIGDSLAQRRLSVLMLGLFAGLALLLAMLGIYGVVSYLVSQRTRELAIRMALGARAAQVMRMVLAEGLGLAVIGVAVGLVGALVFTGVLSSQLHGVSPTDPATLAGLIALVLAVSVLACVVPARRATNVDPMLPLRSE